MAPAYGGVYGVEKGGGAPPAPGFAVPGFAPSGPGGGGGRGGGAPAGRVWVLGPDGKPAALSLQLGIGDGTYTEVARGELKEGQLVIVGVAVPGDRAPSQTGAAPRLRF